MAGELNILHVDMDAFFASVEQLDDPSLRDKPVLVGGDGPRGVVAAASYEARAFGCHSAQPMAVAKRSCPHAIIVPPRGRRYAEISSAVFEILERFTPIVEPLSIDEAFLDLRGTERLFGNGAAVASMIRTQVRDGTGLTASVGVAPNKFLAKLASDMDKPDGLTVIPHDRISTILAPLPIERMWGVGPATAHRLHDLGVRCFSDLWSVPFEVLRNTLGTHARPMVDRSRGLDSRQVIPDASARSVSQERTFGVDVTDPGFVREVLLGQVEQVAGRVRRQGYRSGSVQVKIRFGDFETITRSRSIPEPTDRTDRLWSEASGLFDRWATRFQPVRLIGFGCSRLGRSAEQLGLFDAAEDERQRSIDRVADSIQDRYGPAALHRGARPPRPRHPEST